MLWGRNSLLRVSTWENRRGTYLDPRQLPVCLSLRGVPLTLCDREGIGQLVETFRALKEEDLCFDQSLAVVVGEATTRVSSMTAILTMIEANLEGEIFPIRVLCKGQARKKMVAPMLGFPRARWEERDIPSRGVRRGLAGSRFQILNWSGYAPNAAFKH